MGEGKRALSGTTQLACQRSAHWQSSLEPHRQPVQRRMKSAALPGQRDASGLGLVLPLGCRPATRRPTATATATRVNGGGRRRAAAPEAPGSKTPANGSELRKRSLKIGVTGPRGLTPLLRGPAATVSIPRGGLGAAPGVSVVPAPSAFGGVGARGRTPWPGTQRPANRRSFGERYRRSSPRQLAGWLAWWSKPRC